jgi:hypothetical protein
MKIFKRFKTGESKERDLMLQNTKKEHTCETAGTIHWTSLRKSEEG